MKNECNLIRLPTFRLTRSQPASISCSGRHEEQAYHWQVYRLDPSQSWPGVRARRLWYCLLSYRLPGNIWPITYSHLAERLGLRPGGRTTEDLQWQLQAMANLHCVSSKAIRTRAGGSLDYTGPLFFTEIARKSLTLAPWLVESMKTAYWTPLDDNTWDMLDDHDPIASRLYELLTHRFYRRKGPYSFGYRHLCGLLPLTPFRQFESAQRQLTPVFDLLRTMHLIESVEWRRDTSRLAEIVIRKGAALYPDDPGTPRPKTDPVLVGEALPATTGNSSTWRKLRGLKDCS